MPVPYEIVAAPFTAWLAVTGTAFPLVDAAPAVAWVKVGTSGDRNYAEDGVTVQHPQSLEKWRALGSTGIRKVFRTEESLIISLLLADLTLEQVKSALEYNTVTTVAAGVGVPGNKWVGMYRGLTVNQRALLVRGSASPYGDAFVTQYEVPIVVQIGEPELVYRKDGPALVQLTFEAIEDSSASTEAERFGRLRAQTAVASA